MLKSSDCIETLISARPKLGFLYSLRTISRRLSFLLLLEKLLLCGCFDALGSETPLQDGII